ncbi:MAG TPA: MFS transporter [Micrococcales bacterium]|uniref:MDR family MFS transporter n=1 Tax=Miniimonas arenae TaxID=676201 RepID=UPI000EC44BAB|nr:MDR family MFS transporter [Miniimonas arenae]HCX85224.1 MFS transporter [Micrococcales bacterium]
MSSTTELDRRSAGAGVRAEELNEAPRTQGVLPVMIALMMAMFVSMLASTVVGSSLPVIVADLGGTQSAYTWVVTATLLATTVSTPVWGKIADRANRKMLIMLALTIFVLASAVAGFSHNTEMLITMRVFQGLGAGGLAALSQIVMADIVSPRERGRFAGLFGAAMAVGTVGGPLLGGFLTDTLSWRWNFYIAIPFAVAALALLQRNLHLPTWERATASIDYLGIVLISAGVSLILLWVTFAGSEFEWSSYESYAMIGGAVLLLAVAVWWELRVEDPLLPLTMFKNRTFTLSVIASLATGVAMFATSVYLAQYMQLARGATPMEAGVLTIPMMAGLLLTSTVVGTLVSKRGRWKGFVVTGAVLMIIGQLLLSRLHYDTTYWIVAVSMAVLGAGVGMLMQNLVVVTQNSVETRHLGVATSAITFFRSLGGTIGVSVMGSILGTFVATEMRNSIATLPAEQQAAAAQALGSGTIPKMAELPEAIRVIVESAYGLGIAHVFLAVVPMAVISLIAVLFLPNRPLGVKNGIELAKAESGRNAGHAAGGSGATSNTDKAVTADSDRDEPEGIEEIEDLAIEAASAVGALPPVGSSRRGDGPSR